VNARGVQLFLAILGTASVVFTQVFNPLTPPRLVPPALPPRQAPTAVFRELLAASPTERERQLASRSPSARHLIESKLREFETLPPGQRELRLRVAELQYFLSPLLRANPGSRPELLAQAPTDLRPLLEERLKAWDRLPTEKHHDLLDSEKSLSWFVRLQSSNAATITNLLAKIPPAKRLELESRLSRWKALTPDERIQKTADFQRFFKLSDHQREKVLGVISPAERQGMEATLARFAELPPDQRARTVQGFRQFLSLTATERAEFLQSISKWKQMTPTERAAWRDMVAQITAPTPITVESLRRLQNVATNNSP